MATSTTTVLPSIVHRENNDDDGDNDSETEFSSATPTPREDLMLDSPSPPATTTTTTAAASCSSETLIDSEVVRKLFHDKKKKVMEPRVSSPVLKRATTLRGSAITKFDLMDDAGAPSLSRSTKALVSPRGGGGGGRAEVVPRGSCSSSTEDCEARMTFGEARVPQFLLNASDPCSKLTHFFDVQRLFGECLFQASSENKKKSLSKLLGSGRKEGNAKKRDIKLTKEREHDIANESERILQYCATNAEDFVAAFATLSHISDQETLDEIYCIAPVLMLDRTVTSHERMIPLRLFDCSYLVETGQMMLRRICNTRGMQQGVNKRTTDEQYERVLKMAHQYVDRRVPSLRTAMPVGWALHKSTHTRLSERELAEQAERIAQEFTFLVAGLLDVMCCTDKAMILIEDLILAVG